MKQLTKFMVSIVFAGHVLTATSSAETTWIPIVSEDFTILVPHTTYTTDNNLEIPTFDGLSQGKLVIQCEEDVVYYIMAYNCLRQDTSPSVTASVGDVIVDETGHINNTFYTAGHVERTGPVTITGEVFSGGEILFTWPDWIQTCD